MRTASLRTTGMAGMRGTRPAEVAVPLGPPSLLGTLAVELGRLVARLLAGAVRHPLATGLVVALVLVARSVGLAGLVAAMTLLVVCLVVWRRAHRASYRRMVTTPYRATVVYRRRWQPAMVTCGLATALGGWEYLPTIRRVVASECVDGVLVELLSGQAPEDFEKATPQLAHTFEALRCRVVVDRPGRVWLEFTHTDPLTEPVRAMEPQEAPNLAALPVGRREDGTLWALRLLGTHLLIAGATGSGKGSVLWSLVRALAPCIRGGAVQVWAIDPKGGMELTPGAGLFTRFAYGTPESMVRLLEEAVSFMRHRAERLRVAGRRVHEPTPDDPLVVIVVDELAALTAYVGDRDLKRRAEAALQVLLSQGRAPGVLVVAAVQDPGKDVIAFRDLFPTRVALRLLEDVQVDMVLGRSARQHGAECDQIPPSLPGVGYVVLEGVREPVRVRAAYVSDADLEQMAVDYAPTAEATIRHLDLIENQG
jgi:S-DNA-T family DNA segregation ATPase FtsK/SpoIIIE